jgi:hypothetical protein
MRLTLRTMLAYLDDLLEPTDRDDIGQKIAESEFAGRLVRRIRDVTRNPRLPAPKILGKGMGLDPNTVAEYLDNTLAGERVPDFEKICLPTAETPQELMQSDVYLAEVAACHQILTMVLGQPAQVDPDMKRRMYELADHPEATATKRRHAGEGLAAGADGLTTGSLDDLEIRPARRKPEIPDYLRQPSARFNWKTIAAVIIFALILVGAISMALGPLDHRHPLLGWMFSAPQPGPQVAANAPAGGRDGPTAAQGQDVTPAAQPSGNEVAPAPAMQDADRTASGQTQSTSGIPDNTATSNQTLQPNSAIGATPQGEVPSFSATAAAPTGPLPSDQTMRPDAGSVPPPVPVPEPVGEAATGPGKMATVPDTSKGAIPTTQVPPQGNATIGNPVPPVEEKPLGRFLPANNVVLLRYDSVTSQWLRLPGGAPVSAGDQLLALPNYRPTLGLSAGITLEIPPETLLQLEPADVAGVPGVKLSFGRLVVMTNAKAGTQLRLDVGGASGTVTFVDADARLAVEVRRWLPPGSNPEVIEPRVAADLYAASGQVQWTGADGAITMLKTSQRLSIGAGAGENAGQAVAATLPKWVSPEQLNSTDASCAETLAASLDNNKPLVIALREMASTSNRRVEQRAFAAKCLGLLDDFEMLVSMFGDPTQKAMWQQGGEIASAKAALTRGPETAAKVREAFQKAHGDQAGMQLYRMLLGYTKDQLASGEAEVLVNALDNENLDLRVLAFAALEDITGKAYYYRPDTTAAQRATAVRRWKQDQATGAIIPKEPPPQK